MYFLVLNLLYNYMGTAIWFKFIERWSGVTDSGSWMTLSMLTGSYELAKNY